MDNLQTNFQPNLRQNYSSVTYGGPSQLKRKRISSFNIPAFLIHAYSSLILKCSTHAVYLTMCALGCLESQQEFFIVENRLLFRHNISPTVIFSQCFLNKVLNSFSIVDLLIISTRWITSVVQSSFI